MKATVLQKDLTRVLSYTTRFVSARAQLPILSNIVLIAKGNRLTVKATNLEISISSPIGANVEKEGEIAVPAKVFSELISSLHTEKIEFALKGESLHIEAEGFKANVSGLNTLDFPEIPDTIALGMVLPAKTFSEAISKVIFSSSPDDTRPALSGVLMYSKESTLSFVSSDGFRLSKKDVSLKEKVETKIILPKNILLELLRICQDEEQVNIKVEESDKQILFGVGDSVLSSRLVEGEYPAFEKIIPTSSSTIASVSKDEFQSAVKTAAVFARDGANIVKFALGEDGIVVAAESAHSGSQEAKVAAKIDGPDLGISYNYRYVEEFLNIVKGESVVMKFNSSDASGIFLDASDENYLHLIMPVKS